MKTHLSKKKKLHQELEFWKKWNLFAQTKQGFVLFLPEQMSPFVLYCVSLAAASWLAFCLKYVFADVSLIHWWIITFNLQDFFCDHQFAIQSCFVSRSVKSGNFETVFNVTLCTTVPQQISSQIVDKCKGIMYRLGIFPEDQKSRIRER